LANVPQDAEFFSHELPGAGEHRASAGSRRRGFWFCCLVGCLSWGLAVAAGADLARERRLRAQIEAEVRVGESVNLQTGGLDFLAVHTPATSAKTRGGVILLHGLGANPEWSSVVQPLRTQLPGHGWETLAVQLPLAAADAPPEAYLALIPEALPRLAFAVEFLKSRDVKQVAILGHDLGARTALEWLARDDVPKEIRALVVIGLGGDTRKPDPGLLEALKRVKVPVLDLYGSRDLAPVLAGVQQRAAAARAADHKDYRQLEIEGADHFFTGVTDTLVMRVRAWLAKMVTEAPKEPDKAAAPGAGNAQPRK
jgi:pimeloyl-ACP methyl ester carboxylesterase